MRLIRLLRPAAPLLPLLCLSAGAPPEPLGVWSQWGAFRQGERCHAIAMPEPDGRRYPAPAFATVARWPARGVAARFEVRMGRPLAAAARARLDIGTQRFALAARGNGLIATTPADEARIVAALGKAPRFTVVASDRAGRRFWHTWATGGATTALDAIRLGCR